MHLPYCPLFVFYLCKTCLYLFQRIKLRAFCCVFAVAAWIGLWVPWLAITLGGRLFSGTELELTFMHAPERRRDSGILLDTSCEFQFRLVLPVQYVGKSGPAPVLWASRQVQISTLQFPCVSGTPPFRPVV